MKAIRFIDLFAGIGGFRYGLQQVEIKSKDSSNSKGKPSQYRECPFHCVWSNEWDKYASQIYKKHYKECDTRDIQTVKPSEIPKHDLICAGFPCQSFSIAGKRKGFGDTRGTLFYEILRIARFHRTPYLFLENVKGLLNHDQGQTFSVILESLDELGYDLQWQVLNSKNFGVPQNRERVFIIGHLRGQSRPKVFPIGENGKESNQRQSYVSSCLDSNYYKGSSRGFGGKGRQLIYEGAIMSKKNKQWLKDGKKLSRNFPQGQRVYSADGIGATIAGNAGGLGGKTGLYMVAPNKKKINLTKTPNSPFQLSEHRTELGKQVRREIRKKEGRDSTLRGKDHKEYRPNTSGLANCLTTGKENIEKWLFKDMKIRRLTPTECERLQGFPNGWTKYGIDENGNQVEISDTQRYKVLGNAVTTNVIYEIGKQLA